MDFALFSFLNGIAHRFTVVDGIAVFFATYALPLAMAGVLIVGLKNRLVVTYALYSSALAFVLNAFIGFFFFRSRPFVDYHVIQLIEKSVESKSFPSDHAALSFALAASVHAVFPRAGLVVYVIAASISLARVVVGVHYPSDIIAGACIGLISFILIRNVVNRV